MRAASALLLVLATTLGSASAQDDDQDKALVSKGHRLATAICSACHVATPDQRDKPILKPPAPSFESIVQRKDITSDSLRNFLKTTHRGLDRPKGMPDPSLMDYQITEVIAYILSLRK